MGSPRFCGKGKVVFKDDGKLEDFGESYYQRVNDEDIVAKLLPLLRQGGMILRPADGKLMVESPKMAYETPWHHVNHDPFLDCNTWHSIIFNFLSQELPPGRCFAPSACHQCWKVVVRPPTLKKLFALLVLQQRLGRPSKCGIETREYVHGLYGGYFYNRSLEAGLECYKLVRDEVNKDPELGEDIPVILKRGCTEFEKGAGPSSEWTITAEQIKLESLVNKYVVRNALMWEQPQHLIAHVHNLWIKWAYMNGDSTYKEYTGGKPLQRPVVTYHHLVDADEKEVEEQIYKFRRIYYYDYSL